MIIEPTGGLCNRLRVIFSYLRICNLNNTKLIVIWINTIECTGFFLEYFEPVENITFENKNNNFKIDYKGYNPHKDYPPCYKKLVLLPYIENILLTKKKILNNYISVHIRRTDHIELAKQNSSYTSDQQFIDFIDNQIKNNENINLYIATDNKETYDLFKNKYNGLIKFEYHNLVEGIRQTTLFDSIIDLFMCVNSDYFMGSGYSSFSQLINNIRNNMY